MIGPPLTSTLRIRSFSEQKDFFALTHDACTDLGPDAAVVTVDPNSWVALAMTQSIRTWCDAPVAVEPAGVSGRALAVLASRWAAEDKALYVATQDSRIIHSVSGDHNAVEVGPVSNSRAPELGLNEIPSGYATETVAFGLIRIEPGAG
jgi:hypothetical protein